MFQTQDLLDIENEISSEAIERPKFSFTIMKLLNNREDLDHFHRTVRGVVDECCRRSCTTSQRKSLPKSIALLTESNIF